MIEILERPVGTTDVAELAALLVDAVDGGASVSFLAPLSMDDAAEWWRRTLTAADERALFLVARSEGHIVGTVHMLPATAPNQPHRADVAKLLVLRSFRGRGLGRALMIELEKLAGERAISLATLDTKVGDAAEALYRSLGWNYVGTIPDYARNSDGTLAGTAIFYKRLSGVGA